MEPLNEEAKEFLHEIAARADHAGHVILNSNEVGFASFGQGRRWLELIDPGKRLYKLTPEAQQQLAI